MASDHSRALIIVDVQPTFCEGGELAVDGGNDTAQRIHDYVVSQGTSYDFIATTQDWHIEPGTHFSATPDFVDTWPPHGVAGSANARLHSLIESLKVPHHYKKGQYAAAYSGFEGVELADDVEVPSREEVESAWDQHRTLATALQEHHIDHVDVVGIALSHCVKETAIDAKQLGYTVRVLSDLTVPVSEELGAQACRDMAEQGIIVEPSTAAPSLTSQVIGQGNKDISIEAEGTTHIQGIVDEDMQNDAQILDDSSVPSHHQDGTPVPVTIPIDLAQGITVVYTTRLGGSSQGDFASLNLGGKGGDDVRHVMANRTALAQELDKGLSLVSQVHSGTAIDTDTVWKRNVPYGFDASGSTKSASLCEEFGDSSDHAEILTIAADGQVCANQDIAIGMFAADCLPVLLADPMTGLIAAAHCGRMGLLRGIIKETVALMVSRGAVPERIVATCGPCICGDCYEVGEEIAADFDAHFPGTKTVTRFGGAGVDIAKAARLALHDAGVSTLVSSQTRVDAATQYLREDHELQEICAADGGEPLETRLANMRHSLCTLENPLWYSHRASTLHQRQHEGRMLALIMRS